MYKKFSINQFKLNQMNTFPFPQILIIGKRGSGISFFINNILKHFTHPESELAIVCSAKEINQFYKENYPTATIEHELDDTFLKKILLDSQMFIDSKSSKNKVVVFDSCLNENNNLMDILLNGRYYRISNILVVDDPHIITSELRKKFDYIFLLKDDSTINKKKLWRDYASIFPNVSTFEETFDKCTEDFKAMVIDNHRPHNNISDKIFWFKPKNNCANESDDNKFKWVKRIGNKIIDSVTITIGGDSNTFYPNSFFNNAADNSDSNNESDDNIPNSNNESDDDIPNFNESDDDISDSNDSSDHTINNNNNNLEQNPNFNINYHDNNHEFSLTTNIMPDSSIVKILSDHVIQLRKLQIEYLKLISNVSKVVN